MKQLVNFRDLGGIKNNKGQRVRSYRLLRSGEIVNIGKEDTENLVNNYQLQQIIDLRSDNEIAGKPDDPLEGVQYYQIDVMKNLNGQTSSKKDLSDRLTVEGARKNMLRIYHNLVLDPASQKGYQQFFELLLKNQSGSTIFHCFAGKDRTGFGAALILKLLNVSEKAIMADYLKTNIQRQQANQLIIEDARQKGMDKEHLQALDIAMSVEDIYLVAAFKTVQENFGTFERYVKECLMLDRLQIETLQDMYLEKA